MTDTVTPTRDTQEITSFLDRWVDALRARDAAAYAACYTDDARVFDGMNPPQYQGIDAWGAMIAAWFGEVGTDADLILKDVQMQVNDDLAVVTAFACYKDVPDDGTEPRAMWCRQTDVLRRTPDGWRICHEHSSVPVDHESGQGNFTMQP